MLTWNTDGYQGANALESDTRSLGQNTALDLILTTLMPALEAQAAAEAKQNYVGHYVSDHPSLNSSVTISFNNSDVPAAPHNALTLESWISNDVDLIEAYFGGMRPRLMPNVPAATTDFKDLGRVSFQATAHPQTTTYYDPEAVKKVGVIGPFTGQNVDFE
jgi:hypothetical protein